MAGARRGTQKQRFTERKSYLNLVIPVTVHDHLRQLSEAKSKSMNKIVNEAIEMLVTYGVSNR